MDSPASSISAVDDDTVERIAQRFQVATAEVMRLNRGRMSGLRPKAKMIEGTLILVPPDAILAKEWGKGKGTAKGKATGKKNRPTSAASAASTAPATSTSASASTRPAKRRRGSVDTPITPPPNSCRGGGTRPDGRNPVMPRAPPRRLVASPAKVAARSSSRDARSKARSAAAKMDVEASDDDDDDVDAEQAAGGAQCGTARRRSRRPPAFFEAKAASSKPTPSSIPAGSRKRSRASSAGAVKEEEEEEEEEEDPKEDVDGNDSGSDSDSDSDEDGPRFAPLSSIKGRSPARAIPSATNTQASAGKTAAVQGAKKGKQPASAKPPQSNAAALTEDPTDGCGGSSVDLSTLSPHAQARVALSRMSGVKEVIGREEERAQIEGFLDGHIANRTPASMYISGKPGTGKTATVTAIITAFCAQSSRAAKVVNVNCMTETNPRAIYNRILEDIGGRHGAGLSAAKAQALLEKKHLTLATKQSPMIVLVLDEIDQLETRDCSVLYTAFAWAHKAKSSVILVGIANGLDLTERVLPMLKGRGYSPELLNFSPYSKDQLVAIVEGRMASIPAVDGKPVLEKTSISLCAAKVTSVSGDLRNCLDICKRTVELAEKAKPGERQLGIMMKVFKSILGTDYAQRMRTLPMHQKVALCALYRLDLDGREVTVGKLHEMYRDIATEKRLPTLRLGFYEMLTLMACSGFIELAAMNRNKTHESRQAKVKLRGVADDIKFAFAGDSFISSLLVDPSRSKQMLPDSMLA